MDITTTTPAATAATTATTTAAATNTTTTTTLYGVCLNDYIFSFIQENIWFAMCVD